MGKKLISRRQLLGTGGMLGGLLALASSWPRGLAAAVRGRAQAAGATALRVGADIYQSIGVRPFVNARGTFTILSGSLMLPEVRAAMDAAAQSYVHLDELADAIGARLVVLTEAEWGMVSSGCAAALTHATAACVAGGNPDLHVRIPYLTGFAKDEVVIPKHSRNVYDAAVRAVGVRVIEVETLAELEAALGPRTAMIYFLAGRRADDSELSLQAMVPLARARQVPILVDAAAEFLTIPNVHLEQGATLVGYSGGKCLRGPQAAGLLLGRKDLVRAAWVHSAPHHGFARGLKVGKEEAIGMLMAVEMWVRRDHEAEWKQWTSWLEHIGSRVSTIDGVATTIVQPRGLSNCTPSLRVFWDRDRFGLSGESASGMLFEGEPRVAQVAARGDRESGQTGVSINPYMMSPGDERIVADQLHALLANRERTSSPAPAAPAADLNGTWTVQIEYAAATSSHALHLRQRDNELEGVHQGDFVTRELSGSIDGETVRLRSSHGGSGDSLSYTFSGTVEGDRMSGTLDMGEYRGATWTAVQHEARGSASSQP